MTAILLLAQALAADAPATVTPPGIAPAVELGGGVWLGEYAGQGERAEATGATVGLRGRWRPRTRWAVEGSVGVSPEGLDAGTEVLGFMGDPGAELVAFLGGGVGISGARPFLGAGPGIDIVLTPSLDLRVDLRARMDTSTDVALVFASGLSLHGARNYDLDDDGIRGRADRCADVPEDRDGFEDDDGCPDLDDDLDGLADTADACPRSPEDRDGFLDTDGCPEPDNDGDGLIDNRDACISASEDPDGFQDGDGCPDPDNDADGVLDDDDACPLAPEDRDSHRDDDGCADPDNDGDGLLDALDTMPNAPETFNGWEDADGSPDVVPRVLARLVGPQPRVAFTGDTLTERGEDAFAVMADVLLAYPTMRVRVDLTDADATRLSARAAAVRQVLAREGVTDSRVAVRVELLPPAPVDPAAEAPAPDERPTRVTFALVDPSAAWPPPGVAELAPPQDAPTEAPETVPPVPGDPTWMPAPTETLLAPPPAR
jgi:hypothetical protein